MEHPAKNRYYLLFIEQDLFGTWRLIRAFGSLINSRGRRMMQVYSDEKHAWHEMGEVEYKKRQRGYIYATMPHEDGFYLRPQTAAEITQLKPIKQKLPQTPLMETYAPINPHQQDLFSLS